MSILITTLLVAATAGATTWIGFRCTRESRKLLKEKREEEARKKEISERDGRERSRRDNFNREFLEMLDAVLRDPTRYTQNINSSSYGASKYPYVTSLIDQFRNWEQTGRTNRSQEKQISDLSKTVRELRSETREVHRKLEPYA